MSRRKDRWRKYWYGSVLNMVKHYYTIRSDNSKQATQYTEAIEEALNETMKMQNGEYRVQAIKLVYFDNNYTVTGASMKVYASERTVIRWLNEFVYLVGSKVGF